MTIWWYLRANINTSFLKVLTTKKLKSYQFVFFEGNVKKLESKRFEDKTYVKANVLPSMKRTPYKVVVEFSPTCDVLFLEKLSDGTIRLKRTHDYYIQTQGQLFVSSSLALKGIVFVVYFGDEMPLFKENTFFERSHWNQELLPKLEYFFKRALFPEMVTKRVQRGKLLYLHGRWAPYGQYACTAKGLKLTFKRAQ